MKLRYLWAVILAFVVAYAAAGKALEPDATVDAAAAHSVQDVVEDELDDKKPAVENAENETSASSAAFRLDGMTTSDMEAVREKAEKHEFQAEVNRLMNIIINSLYKNKEIFLRELISNSADALDKIRILSLNDRSQLDSTDELSIRIKADRDKKTIDITDTGIGMTRDDLVRNLGTIAKSGTSEFLEKLTQSKSVDGINDLIGQFGVGFYSTFLIADEVLVTSKHNNDSKQHIWQSDSHSFAIADDPRGNTLPRGTTVTLRLKDEAADFLEEKKLEDLIKKYSQFINFPIYLWSSKTEEVEEPLSAEELEKEAEKKAEEKKKKDEEKKTDDEDAKVEEEIEEDDDKPKTKKSTRRYNDWVQMNNVKPIWVRRPEEVSPEEYRDFYKAISKDWDEPLTWMHFKAEGEVTFRSLLYVPKRSPRDFLQNAEEKMDMIKLYVRRVFITDDFRDMLPKYLFFVRGVVDSDDLPLNVGRETLQQHKLLKVIKKKLVRKVLDMIKKLNQSDFEAFYKEYSTNLKLGLIDDHSNRNRIAKLLLYQSSAHATNLTTLEQYVSRMKTGQDAIYYMTALSRKEAETSPFVEKLLKSGYEVLYLVEPIDEYAMQSLPEFETKRFQHVAKEGLKMEDSEKTQKKLDKMKAQYEPLLKWLQDDLLKGQIEKAGLSDRLTETPCALVAKSYGWSGNFEKIRKAQAYAKNDDPSTSFYANQKKILELNPGHPVVRELLSRVVAEKTEDDDVVLQSTRDMALLLYDAAVLRSGYVLNDVGDSFKRIERMLRRSMNIDLNAEVEEPEIQAGTGSGEADEDEGLGKDGIERENLKLSKPGVGDGFGGGDVGDFEDTIQHEEL